MKISRVCGFNAFVYSPKSAVSAIKKTNKLHNFAHCGHIITAERLKNGNLIYYDEQRGELINIKEYASLDYLEVIKVDKLLLNEQVFVNIAEPL